MIRHVAKFNDGTWRRNDCNWFSLITLSILLCKTGIQKYDMSTPVCHIKKFIFVDYLL